MATPISRPACSTSEKRSSNCQQRLVPLHPSVTRCLNEYAQRRDQLVPAPPVTGSSCAMTAVQPARRACSTPYRRSAANWAGNPAVTAHPRLHDLRHTFIVTSTLHSYRQGTDVGRTVLALSAYVGHAKVSDTYWYFTGVPELMAIAAERFHSFAQRSTAMSPLLADPAEFATLLQRFFTERLLQQKNASPKTVTAYRDTFRLLLRYAQRETGKPPVKLALNDFDVTLVLGFLNYLETERHNTVRSRNARLAALRAFAHYVSLQCPTALQLAQQILAIPMKRFEKPLLGFLSRDEVQAVLAAPSTADWCGRRDRIMLSLLYNTGARVSEITAIRVADITLAPCASARLHGKGRKQRTVPLWKETVREIRRWLEYAGLQRGSQRRV